MDINRQLAILRGIGQALEHEIGLERTVIENFVPTDYSDCDDIGMAANYRGKRHAIQMDKDAKIDYKTIRDYFSAWMQTVDDRLDRYDYTSFEEWKVRD